jgi:hypothetical protein
MRQLLTMDFATPEPDEACSKQGLTHSQRDTHELDRFFPLSLRRELVSATVLASLLIVGTPHRPLR